jgi:hypothetical protein
VTRRIALIAACGLAAGALAVEVGRSTSFRGVGAGGVELVRSPHMLIGLNDDANTLYGNPATTFQTLHKLRVQVVRVNLYWGGNQWAVANRKPTADPTDPGDRAYNWSLYDRLVMYAHTYDIRVVFSILGTPSWANGGGGPNRAPTRMADLENFAHAAAVRYSGYWTPPRWQFQPTLGVGKGPLPAVKMWTAWNEPNNPIFLTPQYRRAKGKWVVQSGISYAKICDAVYRGIHRVLISPKKGLIRGEKVACGVTAPKGNDAPTSARPSVDPLTFLTAAKKAGMGPFDAYAHNPYAATGNEPPSYVPSGKTARRIQMGNLNLLTDRLTKYYGPTHLWITEYGYQTNPPDETVAATTWAKQALYMRDAVSIARSMPRVDMFVWFLIRDEPDIRGWQSGLETVSGKHKPSWRTFIGLPRG